MAWIYLLLAGLMEVGFTTCLKLSDNFQNKLWAAGFVACAVLSFHFLNKASQTIPLGMAYAAWTGIGAVGTVLVGALLFKVPFEAKQVFFIVLLLVSVLGLKFTMNEGHDDAPKQPETPVDNILLVMNDEPTNL